MGVLFIFELDEIGNYHRFSEQKVSSDPNGTYLSACCINNQEIIYIDA